ncbi:hypothetical protein C2G38_2203360 [Gigaspora rosea]|uniref:Uncharacterized protein n=1 Tax=Gigaspora rosea TaxID=44941 RepID=A0A397UW57_9GLOM|nr:hypothetical protein C2G38_2203360 [Gigaspora rosea]
MKDFAVTQDLSKDFEYGGHFSISSSEDETCKEDRDKSDDNDSENDKPIYLID